MRTASDWAQMYANHVGVTTPEELDAFAAAIQRDALKSAFESTKAEVSREVRKLQKTAGVYPDDLFE